MRSGLVSLLLVLAAGTAVGGDYAERLLDIDRTVGTFRIAGTIAYDSPYNNGNIFLQHHIRDWKLTLDNGTGTVIELLGPYSGNNSVVSLTGEAFALLSENNGPYPYSMTFDFLNADGSTLVFSLSDSSAGEGYWSMGNNETIAIEGVQASAYPTGVQRLSIPHEYFWKSVLKARDVDGDGKVDAYYDAFQDISWVEDSHYAEPAGYLEPAWPDNDWHAAVLFIDHLNSSQFLGVTGWRMPHQPSTVDATDGELGRLKVWLMGGSAGPFKDICQCRYWSGTESGYNNYDANWFDFREFYVSGGNKGNVNQKVWAVRDGDIGGSVPVQVASLDLDPWSTANTVYPESEGIIPVAVMGASFENGDGVALDVTTIDPETVRFGAGQAQITAAPWIVDLNSDGNDDAVFLFDVQSSGISCDDSEVGLTGMTSLSIELSGTDTIQTADCESSSCHP